MEFDLIADKIEEGWDGFIDPNGNFYPTKPVGINYWNGSFNVHKDCAEVYVEKNYPNWKIESKEHPESDNIINEMDYLIMVKQWMSFTNIDGRFYFSTPTFDNKKITKKQKETVFKIFKINDYPMDVYFETFED